MPHLIGFSKTWSGSDLKGTTGKTNFFPREMVNVVSFLMRIIRCSDGFGVHCEEESQQSQCVFIALSVYMYEKQ